MSPGGGLCAGGLSPHPAPEGGFVGDTMPFVTGEGTLERYCLYDTDHNGQGYHPIYRFTS